MVVIWVEFLNKLSMYVADLAVRGRASSVGVYRARGNFVIIGIAVIRFNGAVKMTTVTVLEVQSRL